MSVITREPPQILRTGRGVPMPPAQTRPALAAVLSLSLRVTLVVTLALAIALR